MFSVTLYVIATQMYLHSYEADFRFYKSVNQSRFLLKVTVSYSQFAHNNLAVQQNYCFMLGVNNVYFVLVKYLAKQVNYIFRVSREIQANTISFVFCAL